MNATEEPRTQGDVESLRNAQSMKNVVCLADVMPELLARLEETGRQVAAFSSELKEQLAQVEREHCIEHEELELPIDEDQTLGKSWFEQKLVIVYGQCPKCLEDRRKLLVNEKWRRMGIPEKVLHATFQNFNIGISRPRGRVIARTMHQVERRRGFLILRGTVGTGKSHLAAAALKTIGEGVFVTEADLIAELRQTYSDNSGQNKMVEKYRQEECMVLDELTTEVKGADIPSLLYRILGDRYDKGKLTIVTSNEPLSIILDIFGERITDRITEDYYVATCEWESFRKKMKSE